MTDRALASTGPRILVPLLIVGVSLALRFVPAWIAPMTLFHFIGMGVGPLRRERPAAAVGLLELSVRTAAW